MSKSVTEPVYEYIRGKGWNPKYERSIVTKDRDGKSIIVIERVPNKGEAYCCISKNDTEFWDANNNCIKFDELVSRHIQKFALNQFWGFQGFDNETNYVYVVILAHE